MEKLTAPEEGVEYFMPSIDEEVVDAAPDTPNAYSDGSLKNTKGYFWSVGGAGVWWPARKASTLTAKEKHIAEYREVEPARSIFEPQRPEENGGLMLWSPFNARLNSSTRCELGAAIIALLSPYGLNIGIDNATVVERGNAIIKHLRKQQTQSRYSQQGAKLLGGCTSRLHRPSPYKQRWALMQDGDLWEVFTNLVKQRGPHSV